MLIYCISCYIENHYYLFLEYKLIMFFFSEKKNRKEKFLVKTDIQRCCY